MVCVESLFEDASKLLKNVNRRLCALEDNYQDFKKEIRKESKEREYLERIAGLELAMERREHLLVQSGDQKLLLQYHLQEAHKALCSLLKSAEKELDQSATEEGLDNCDILAKVRQVLFSIDGYWMTLDHSEK